jgi:NADH:ubiquinone oxidoreductase subunit F (NADH-binding)/(2Fe-2S) ferredoxin
VAKIKPEDLKRIKAQMAGTMNLREGDARAKVTVHMGTCGIAAGARTIMNKMMSLVEEEEGKDIIVTASGCAGLCSREPMMTVELKGEAPFKYVDLDEAKTERIFQEHVLSGNVVTEYALALGSEPMKPYRMHLMLCAGTGCVSNKAFKVREVLEEQMREHNLQDEVGVVMTGCNGFCAQGPVMVVQPDGIFYQLLDEEAIPHLVEEHFLKGRPVEDLMFTPPGDEAPVPIMSDIGFFSKQRLIALRNRGMIDPEKIDEYIARDGYSALVKSLTEMTPEEIVEEVKTSGLRGRGGAGFPTGLKWEICRHAEGDSKHIICNADEGDPGAFMDRSIIESDPHSVLEGMAIGARAIGAAHGHVYIRYEYPLARERLIMAIEQAREYGLLGHDILGTGFDFDISIHRGAGAFVCGEETSLIASLEGRPPEPRVRPPFPAHSGFWGEPTNINNVESWANIPEIVNRGGAWFAGIGTEKSKGTKVFALVGKVKNTGLVEVPMGITLEEIVYDIGGGIDNDKRFKAVQTGGPSGGCLPASLLKLPIDYERLAEAGSIMGSGGMIVLDEDTCMVDVARYFLEFLRDES